MNFLVVGKFYKEGFALHIAETLEAMGHQVTRFNPGQKVAQEASVFRKRLAAGRSVIDRVLDTIPAVRARATKRLLQAAGAGPISMTIVCHDFLLPAEVSAVRALTGAPIVLWFPDAIVHFDRATFLVGPYDRLFFKDPYMVRALRAELEAPAHYLPECWNPASMPEVQMTKQDIALYACDIATAGNLYPSRVAFFSRLEGYDVKIWGNPAPTWLPLGAAGPMVQNRFVADQTKVKAFRAAKIVLNNLHPAEIWGINARSFEICGAGGFQLVSWRPGLSQLFRDGEEVVSYHSLPDLRAKLDHYLANDDERKRIALAGKARADRDHTYRLRLQQLIDVGLNGGEAYPLPDISYSIRE